MLFNFDLSTVYVKRASHNRPLVLFGSSLTMKMLGKKPDGKTEIFTVEVLKVLGHQ